MAYYETPDQFSGKTLNQLGGQYNFNPEVLASFLGIKRDDTLQSGKSFNVGNIPGVDPSGSSELKFLTSNFTQGMSPEQKAAKELSDKNAQTLTASKNEAVGTLESGKAPLKARYDEVISSIKGTSEQRLSEADTATAREFGKRGVPLTSGVYDTAIQGARAPIDAATASALSNTALQEQQQLGGIDSAIANIQAATGMNQVEAALQAYQIGEQARQFGLTFEEGIRQFNEQLKQQKELSQPSSDPYAQYKTISEGQTLFDLLSGQSVYTAPKTYKPTGGGGDSDPLGLGL